MAEGTRAQKRASSPNWLASLVGAVFLISTGFALGLVVGVVREEPDLVLAHVAGQSEEVPWSGGEAGELPGVAAGPVIEDAAAYEDPALEEVVVDTPVIAAEDIASPAYAASAEAAGESAAPTAAARAPTAATTASRSGFSVQVGAFAQNAAAEEVASGLREKGYPVYVTPSADPNDGRWRVRVGPLPSRGEADEIAGRLKSEERLPTWVLREGGG